jgi:2-succinyl-5-enolpyruvyl-6-hydroxy-3-cyclohexene-1-carboxylate synthase
VNTGLANLAYSTAFVDELARSGLEHACVSPGSRSTPLALAFAQDPRIRLWVHIDERSAAYFALGLAKAARKPVALLCTSGTAAANFYPAVVEARYGRVPLLVLTADRPPELRENGAPQAIDQLGLYGRHAKWFAEMATPDETPELQRYVRAAACRAHATALSSPPGPVHLNFPFREPLLPAPDDALETGPVQPGRPGGEPWTRVTQGRRRPEPALIERLAREFGGIERGLIVCGPHDDPGLAGPVALLARRLGYPVLADALSPLRSGPHDRSLVLDSYDAFLREPEWPAAHAPEVVLRFGALPTSKPLVGFLQRHPESRQIVVDEADAWRDPTLLAAEMVYADPALLCCDLAAALGGGDTPRGGWAAEWLRANGRSRAAIDRTLGETGEMSEAGLFAELSTLLPEGSTLYVGNSMPVRDLDSFFGSTPRRVRALCNRGANGIDGVVSSALGASAVSEGPTVLAIGDLSFYHDLNGLLAARLYNLDLTVLLVNNDGGGIFSFLPQTGHPRHFEELWGTPTGLDFRAAVEMYGGEHVRAETYSELRAALTQGMQRGGLTVVEVRTDRERNVRLHRELWAGVSRALAESPVGAAT